jgi:hypothetical protein
MRIKKLPENSFEIPLSARDTTKEIEAERTVFRKRVAREVRLRQKAKAGNPSGAGKLVPLGFADRPKFHFPNDANE